MIFDPLADNTYDAVASDFFTALTDQFGACNVEILGHMMQWLIENADRINDLRQITVRFDYEEEPSSYHSFHTEAGARQAIAEFLVPDAGTERCLLMIPGREHEWVEP